MTDPIPTTHVSNAIIAYLRKEALAMVLREDCVSAELHQHIASLLNDEFMFRVGFAMLEFRKGKESLTT